MLQVFRERTPSLLILLSLVLLATAGCLRSRAEEEVAAALPLDNSLPESWRPIRPVQEINLDGDVAPEYLLFFTYEGANGPIGAIIYDNRVGDTIQLDGEESSRPSASLMPYPILPSYRSDGGLGFIAQSEQQGDIGVYPLNFRTAAGGETTPNEADEGEADEGATDEGATEGTQQTDLLAILGGTTYITFVWWQPEQESYGIKQLHTPSHFETEKFQPFPWESWRETPQPIEEIISVYPVHDRNLLCYRRRHTLTAPAPEALNGRQPIRTVEYRTTNMGLDFCSGTPAAPFYPEGVVLAYLSNGATALLDPNLDDAARQEIQATAVPESVVYVNDLASYKTVSNGAAENNGVQVCVEILRPGTFYRSQEMTVAATEQGNAVSAESTEPDSAPAYALQWLLFTLRHEPFQLDPPPPQPDRLFITKVSVLPVATRNIPLECRVQLGDQSR